MKQKYRKIRYVTALSFLGVAAAVLLGRYIISKRGKEPEVRVVEANCTESGYSVYTYPDGHTEIRDVTPARGHSFSDWSTVREVSHAECGQKERTCTVCGCSESDIIFPQDSIAKLALYGSLEGISKTEEVDLTGKLLLDGQETASYFSLKKQGHESLAYEKNNYTIKFFKDAGHSEKNKLELKGWKKEHKYVLKANYYDTSHCRNIVVSDIWAAMTADRENTAEELKGLSNWGAIDGFPVAVYLNDSFFGLYTMNLHKDDDLFGIQEGKKQAVAVLNYHTSGESEFRGLSSFLEESDWEIEACGTEDTLWAQTRLNELLAFVAGSPDEEFRKDLENYLDVNASIDYLIALYALGLPYNGACDLVLVTYDGQVWIPSIYDAGKSFGLSAAKGECFSADEFLPVLGEASSSGTSSGTGSLLWDRLLSAFPEQIAERYRALRKNILSEKNLTDSVKAFLSGIPEVYYEADLALYPGENQIAGGHEAQITKYISERLPILDRIFAE